MFVAEQLGKFEHEVAELTPDEFARWLAYFKLKREREEKARKKNQQKSSKGGRRRR